MDIPDHIYEAAKTYFNCGPGKLFVHPQNPPGEYYFCSLNGQHVDTAILNSAGKVVFTETGDVSGLTVLLNDRADTPTVGHVFD